MAYITSNPSSSSGQSYFKSFFQSVRNAWVRYFERAKAIRELEKLDQHELHDLGISRGDFQNIVDGKFNRTK